MNIFNPYSLKENTWLMIVPIRMKHGYLSCESELQRSKIQQYGDSYTLVNKI